jgi:hypothetical protein
MLHKTKSLEVKLLRYWTSESGCHEWALSRDKDGYGLTTIDGRQEKAHRAAWVFHNGPIPNKMWVLHRCDNPSCINVSHLFLGTNQDNVDDMQRKGRGVQGHRNGQARLTPEAVMEMRRLSTDYSTRELAYIFSIGLTAARDAVTRRTWRHI